MTYTVGDNCQTALLDNSRFCHNCGNNTNTPTGKPFIYLATFMTGRKFNFASGNITCYITFAHCHASFVCINLYTVEEEASSNDNETVRERELIEHYFHIGYSYEVIVDFLKKHHGLNMSLSSLKRRLRKYGLKKRNSCVDETIIRNLVRVEMANAGEQSGYRTIWHALRLIHHVHPPRRLVAQILRELDPDACIARRSRKLTRRKYLSPGPNNCWHVDGMLPSNNSNRVYKINNWKLPGSWSICLYIWDVYF